ncbi:MAG: glycosyltransferase, partial [bacterium]|nr:glycosyltransferase [bacterium]
MNKISIVIAAYHGEKYIGEQLKSLFKQTRIPDEILIGDDSSDDKTFLAVEAVRSHYTGELKYFRNTPRLGVVQNFVHLAKAATGDFIF